MQNQRGANISPGLNLGALEHNDKSKISVLLRSKKRVNNTFKPHKVFRNWTQGYRIPWLCFIECAMLICYLLVGYINEHLENDFTIDFTKIVDDYFLSDYDFDDPPEMSNSWVGRIYFKEQFIEIAQSTGNRLFEFPESLPLAYPFESQDAFYIEVVTIGGEELVVPFTKENLTLVTPFVNAFVDNFAQLVMTMKYTIQLSEDGDNRLEMSVIGEFTRDTDSDQIILDFYHTRIPHKSDSTTNFMTAHVQSIFPALLILFGLISIILTIVHTQEVYNYVKEKAESNFQRTKTVFWEKYDKWNLFSLVCNVITVVSCVLYIIYGEMFKDQLPFTNVLMGVSSFLHCFLLFRYLRQKPSTMIIVNVIFSAAVTFLQFLVGCMIIFAGYLVLGCSLFGTFCVNFATFTQGAVVLIAVIHGDSIQDMYDTIMVRADIPWWCGFIYMSGWVFFSLTVMFNISISIFEESLTVEIYKNSDADNSDEPAPIEAITMSLPKSYRTVF